ncbi:hypothetical protein RJ639_002631 [Escallonia herrerae]|uniref:Uncharacterized protein n=1 Tax=Escallonia herrerae TaxID=1293975 RepID=A0AA89BJ52_9ASTE|nr:hypothetical protein RJ639_002631 [Escallonia herrerae]
MSQDSEEIKTIEQWRWSEMQGLELVSPEKSPSSSKEVGEEQSEQNRGEREQEMEAPEGSKKEGSDGEKPNSALPSAGFGELFRFADGLDYILMGIGTVGAFVHGCSLPLFLRFFADLVNSFGSNANNIDKMTQEVLKYAFYFLVVGAAIWASSWAEISCWMWTGERQSTRMRIKYLEAALNQDIQYFDTQVRTSDVVFAINTDAVMVQDAISEKLGNFIHYMATFVSGFVVGFTAVWQLALVTLAVVPLIAVIGAIHATTLAKLSSKSQEALSQAGNIAEQTIVQIRTVMAFVGESRAIQAYTSALKIAQRLGYKTGFSKGMGLGATYFTVFCCYALLLWYGGYLVRHHYTNGGLAIATMFSVMIGGLALGQSAPSMSAFAKAKVAAAKIFCMIDHKPSVDKNGESGLELGSVSGQVELQNVDFCYPSRPEVQILNNLSLSVPAGKTIALVGSSGSGKSTVVSLIERFYDPTSGNSKLDNDFIIIEPVVLPSSARNSVSSPIIARNSSYGRSPYSRRLSDFSTSDFSLSLDASHPNYRLEKLAFKEQASSFWRLAKMNSPEWTYALVGSLGSVICGSLSAFFAYVLSAVLSVYYSQDHAYMIRQIALVLIAVFPLVVAATVLQKMFMKGFSGDLEAAHSKATQLAAEAVANVRTVAAFNSESKIVGLFTSNLQTPLRRCFWKGQIAGSGYGIAQFLLYASYALGLWYASWLVKHGISDFSKTIRVFMVLMVSANGAAETLTLAPDFIKGGRAMQSVFDLLDRKTEIEPDDPDASPVPDRIRGEVELKHVDFSYPSRPDMPVFRDLTLRARAGKTLALVGPSGCGKSSVIALIQRFYEPSSGRVMIDGKDIRKYNLKALRRHIAMAVSMASGSTSSTRPKEDEDREGQ